MEDAFNKLKQQGKNTVDTLIKWMQESGIVNKTNVSEDKARRLFADVQDTTNVELTKFQEAISKLAAEQKRSVEEFTNTLAAEGTKFVNAAVSAAQAGANAASTTFAETMKK